MPTCPCCQCTLPPSGSSGAAADGDQQPFTFGAVLEFCNACADLVNAKIEEEGLNFFVSHIVPEHVSWSSHPELVRPSPKPFPVRMATTDSSCRGDGAGGDDDARDIGTMLELAARALIPRRCGASTSDEVGLSSISTGTSAESGSGGGSHASAAATDGPAPRRGREPSLRVLVVAGAGMSCDSGLPDFRGAHGFYRVGTDHVRMEQINFHDEEKAFPEDCDIRLTWWCASSITFVAERACARVQR
jgi:hypothetical protein